MFTLERQKEIYELIKKSKSISVRDLSQRFFISEASIRRDLNALEKRGLVKRTYGGAIIIDGENIEIPFTIRGNAQRENKIKIARLASELIQNQDAIFMDSSTTTKEIIPFLSAKNNLTVITNGIQTINELSELENISVFSVGGKLRRHSLSTVGSTANAFVRNISASKLFFSCTGISMSNGAMDYSDEEAELRKLIMSHCETIVLLVDHTKFGHTAFYKICDFDAIDIIITDQKPSEEWCNVFNNKNVNLICPG